MLFLPLSIIFTDIFERFPQFTEDIYAAKLRPIIMKPLSLLFSLLPFSAAEFTVVAGVIIAVIAVIIGAKHIINKIKSRGDFKCLIFDYITRIISVISCVAFVFTLTYGGCYYRPHISETLGLYSFDHNAADIANTAMILIEEMSGLREKMNISDDEIFTLDITFSELSDLCRQTYASLGQENAVFDGDYGKAKAVLLSKPWTYTFVMGMYFPFTGEANININIPDSELPQTILHEMAHQRGIAREEDADFAAFYASRDADDRLKYSADLEALDDVLNCLYLSDYQKYTEVVSEMSDGIKRDFNESSRFWSNYQTKVAEISSDINNIYLDSNGQEMGVAAYDYSAWLIMDYYANQWRS